MLAKQSQTAVKPKKSGECLPSATWLELSLLPAQTTGLLGNSGATSVTRLWCRCSLTIKLLQSPPWSQGTPGLSTSWYILTLNIVLPGEVGAAFEPYQIKKPYTGEKESEPCQSPSLPKPVKFLFFLTTESQRRIGYTLRASTARIVNPTWGWRFLKIPSICSLFNSCSRTASKPKCFFGGGLKLFLI